MANRLPPCPGSPNCVSSQHEKPKVEAFAFTGDPVAAMDRLEELVTALPGTQIEAREALFLHATFHSKALRFVDDFHAEADPDESVIHWRSASRSGYWDFGVNKKRIELLRAALNRIS